MNCYFFRDDEDKYSASKMAIATIMKSWPGLIRMCKPDGSGLQSLLGVLYLPNMETRVNSFQDQIIYVACSRTCHGRPPSGQGLVVGNGVLVTHERFQYISVSNIVAAVVFEYLLH